MEILLEPTSKQALGRKNKAGVGVKILIWMITDEMKLTEHYRMYAAVFGVDVPTTQSQPIESTQGTHRTTSAPRRSTRLTPLTPIPTTDEADDIILQDTIQLSFAEQKSCDELEANKMLEPRSNKESPEGKITIEVQPVNTIKEEEESAEDDYELRRREKGTNVEESRHTPSPTTIRSLRIHFNLKSLDTGKLQELTVNDQPHSSSTPSSSSSKLSAINHILSLFKPKTVRFKRYKSFFDELQGRYGYLFEHLKKGLHPRKNVHSQVDVAKMIADAIHQECENLQAQISSQINNVITIPSRVDSSIRNYMSSNISHGGNSAKRQKTSEHGTYVFGESSSGQVNEIEPGPSTSGNQEQLDDFDFWTDSYAIDDDELPTEKVSQELVEEMSQIVNEAKLRKVPASVVQSCQRDPKAHALSLVNQDLLYLKKGNSRSEKIVLSLHKFPAVIFPDDDTKERTSIWVDKCVKKFNPYARYSVDDYIETGLLWSLSVFIRSTVIWERVHDFQLGVESYQSKVNLTAPTITFPGIEMYKVFFIVFEPVYGIIYKNINKEKRVMRHQEIHKFCDATLNRVLEGLKSYNNNVKHGYVTPSLSKEDVEYVQLFEEEIEEPLKHHDQMRR
ncbi:hypothetical protein Tco_0640259 [Tanacetum coccineum]